MAVVYHTVFCWRQELASFFRYNVINNKNWRVLWMPDDQPPSQHGHKGAESMSRRASHPSLLTSADDAVLMGVKSVLVTAQRYIYSGRLSREVDV